MRRVGARLVLLLALAAGSCVPAVAPDPDVLGPGPTGELRIDVLDVGQGDAVLIREPGGRALLYDGGPSRDGALEQLLELGVERLDLVIASHPHADHINGLAQVIRHFRPPSVLDNGLPHTTLTWERYAEAVRAAGSRLIEPEARRIELGALDLRVLPPPGEPEWGLNDNSVGLVVRFGAVQMVLGGDAEERQWDWWLDRAELPSGPVSVHKASHHGSRNGDTGSALRRLLPEIVVVSAGAGNSHGHPHAEALQRYRSVGASVLRTDRRGAIVLLATSDGEVRIMESSMPSASGVRP